MLVGDSVPTTVLTSHEGRKGFVLCNESGTLYVKFGLEASTTSYAYRLGANSMLEVDNYRGVVTAIKAADTSYVTVTDLR